MDISQCNLRHRPTFATVTWPVKQSNRRACAMVSCNAKYLSKHIQSASTQLNMPVLFNNTFLPCTVLHPDRKPTGYTTFRLFAIDPPCLGLNAHKQVSLNTITHFHDHCRSNVKRKQRCR